MSDALFCSDCKAQGLPDVPATHVAYANNQAYCLDCWYALPFSIKSKGGMLIGPKGAAPAKPRQASSNPSGLSAGPPAIEASAEEHSPAATMAEKGEKTMSLRSAVSDDEIRRLHAQRLTDAAIAQKVGMSAGGVLARRRKLGLKANFRKGERRWSRPRPRRTARAAPKRPRYRPASGRPVRRSVKELQVKTISPIEADGDVVLHVHEEFLDAVWHRLTSRMKAQVLEALEPGALKHVLRLAEAKVAQ